MIQVNNKVRIRVFDSNNLVIEELRTVTSNQKGTRQEWCHCGYYGTLRSSLAGVLDKALFETVDEKLTLQELANRIDTIEQEVLCIQNKNMMKQ